MIGMRIWHILVVVFALACLFGIARNEVGRVSVVMFMTGLCEIILGTTALMHLFKTIGSFGQAKTLTAHLEAIVQTLIVLVAATAAMNFVFWVGGSLLKFVLEG